MGGDKRATSCIGALRGGGGRCALACSMPDDLHHKRISAGLKADGVYLAAGIDQALSTSPGGSSGHLQRPSTVPARRTLGLSFGGWPESLGVGAWC